MTAGYALERPRETPRPSDCCHWTVYADLIGQTGPVIDQLLERPPEGYRFVTQKKMTTRIAERTHAKAWLRKAKRSVQRYVPSNLLFNYCFNRFQKPPAPVDLTYSMSTPVFRPEPWVLYVESANQLAGFNHRSLARFRGTVSRALASPRCRAIICQSEAARRGLLRQLDSEWFAHKLRVVRCGWEPKTPPDKPLPQPGAKVRILFVGAATMAFGFAIKGGPDSLEAFAILRQRYPQVELTVRSDVDPSLRRKFEGLEGLHIISEKVSASEIEALYRQADIYWYPAHSLMSISVLEAMSYALPVVTTNYFDNHEYVADGRTGLIVAQRRRMPAWDTSELEVRRALERPDPNFVAGLAAQTAVLIENPELRYRLGQAARAEVETRFSLAEKNSQFKRIFDQAVGAR